MELAKRNKFSQDSVFSIPLFLLAALLIFSHSVTEPVDHDEHQFVASAALLARRGLLPYRDYPYLHTPYLVSFDAAVFRLEGGSARLLLTARLLSAACVFATVMLLAAAVQSLYRDSPITKRWATIAAVLLLLTNPLFTAVIGLAWNHDAAELLLFAATLFFLGDIQRGSFSSRSMLAAGALLGLSIGVRLTVAPAVAAFAGWALADARVPWRRRFLASGLLLLGITVALAPCAWLCLQSPPGFLFGNFGYPSLNTAYRIAHDTMISSTTPAGKIAYFLSRIVFSSGTGFLLLLIALTTWLRREKLVSAPTVKRQRNVFVDDSLTRYCFETQSTASSRHPERSEEPALSLPKGSLESRKEEPLRCAQGDGLGPSNSFEGREEMKFLGLLILFLLAGSFAPAPMFIVYFYAPVPFAVLWLAYAWRPLVKASGVSPPPEYRERGREVDSARFLLSEQYRGTAAILTLCCIACGIPAYRHLPAAFRPSLWVPLEVHDSGVTLRRQLGSAGRPPGPVLTLAPIIPLEGGLDIYESFATGPFAFRAAPMVPESERPALHLVDEHDLSQLLKDRPPMAVLFNVEEREEEMPMLEAVPNGCLMVRLVHGSRFSIDRKTESGKR